MPRKGMIQHREVKTDPVFNTPLVEKFVNCMMWDGKKATTEAIFYNALESLRGKGEEDPLKLFKKAVENVKPLMEVKSRRVGGANYQIPVEVSQDRRTSLGIRWIIGSARKRGEKGMTDRLAAELLDAYNNRGTAIKKKEDTHRMAEANRAFAHYRW
jgi:small subunit ribosomal protein S7